MIERKNMTEVTNPLNIPFNDGGKTSTPAIHTEDHAKNNLFKTRRRFLIKASLLTGSLVATTIAPNSTRNNTDNSQYSSKNGGEGKLSLNKPRAITKDDQLNNISLDRLLYSGNSKEIIDKILKNHHLDVYSESEPGNIPWGEKDLSILQNAVDGIPKIWQTTDSSPQKIVLHKINNPELNNTLQGNYQNRRIDFIIPANFNAHDLCIASLALGAQMKMESALYTSVFHEWAHTLTEAIPEMLKEWINITGWHQRHGLWINDRPSESFHVGNADQTPTEDFAFSTQMLVFHYPFLSDNKMKFYIDGSYRQYFTDLLYQNGYYYTHK